MSSSGATGTDPGTPAVAAPATSETLDLDLTGMTCAGCAARIEKRLNRLEGVDASVNFATERARVRLSLRRRLVVAVVLGVPVLLLSMIEPLQFRGWQWVALVLATPVATSGAWPFHRTALRNLRHRQGAARPRRQGRVDARARRQRTPGRRRPAPAR